MCLNEHTWLEIWEKKRKVDCSKRPSEKKNGLEQKQKEKNEERKKVEVQFELYCVKLVELMVLFEKNLLH